MFSGSIDIFFYKNLRMRFLGVKFRSLGLLLRSWKQLFLPAPVKLNEKKAVKQIPIGILEGILNNT